MQLLKSFYTSLKFFLAIQQKNHYIYYLACISSLSSLKLIKSIKIWLHDDYIYLPVTEQGCRLEILGLFRRFVPTVAILTPLLTWQCLVKLNTQFRLHGYTAGANRKRAENKRQDKIHLSQIDFTVCVRMMYNYWNPPSCY